MSWMEGIDSLPICLLHYEVYCNLAHRPTAVKYYTFSVVSLVLLIPYDFLLLLARAVAYSPILILVMGWLKMSVFLTFVLVQALLCTVHLLGQGFTNLTWFDLSSF